MAIMKNITNLFAKNIDGIDNMDKKEGVEGIESIYSTLLAQYPCEYFDYVGGEPSLF